MKIYTKTGDKGKTSLASGKRVFKNDPRIEAYGNLDELNSLIGIVRALKISKKTDGILEKIQRDIFSPEKDTVFLEKSIDEISASLPPLRNFILPTGSLAGSFLHLARAVCRRAERKLIPSPYLNRLSDLLFVLARFENKRAHKK